MKRVKNIKERKATKPIKSIKTVAASRGESEWRHTHTSAFLFLTNLILYSSVSQTWQLKNVRLQFPELSNQQGWWGNLGFEVHIP